MYSDGILYKYRCWDDVNHKKTLKLCQLFFASPYMFNDPFDCNIPFVRKHNEDEMKKVLSKYSNQSASKVAINLITKYKIKKFDIDEAHKRVQNNIKSNISILSLTENPTNILMWSHYANNHKGFCLGFDKTMLYKSISKFFHDKNEACWLYPVEYGIQFPPEIFDFEKTSNEDFLKYYRTKATDWSYEQEVRILKIGNSGSNVYTFNPKILKEIILGCAISQSDKKEIINLISNCFPITTIYQANKSSKSFELILERCRH